MFSRQVRSLALAVAFIASLSSASAQTYPTVPNNSVIGRIGVGTGTGPAQAIPFTSLPWTINSTPINGGANGQILYDNNGKVGEYSASAARTYLGLAGVYSVACSSNQWISAIVAGVPGCTQPSFSSLTGNISVSQMGSGTGATANTVFSGGAVWAEPQEFRFTPINASPSVQSIKTQLRKIPVSCEDYSGGCTTTNITQAINDAIFSGRCFQFNGTYTTTSTITIDGTGLGGASNLCIVGRGGLVGPSSGTFNAVLELKNLTGTTVDGNVTISCNSNAYIGAGLKIWSSGVGLSAQFQNIGFSQFANCRRAIQIGDPTQSTLPISEINISKGFFYNVAQGIRVYSSNAVVNASNFTNIVDPHSSGNWALTGTGTCTTNTITISSPGANSYFDQYDAISGTGIVAGTYITGQTSGALGGAGVYSLSTSGNTCSAAAITGEKRGINIWTSGGTVSVSGGEVLNTVVNNGYLCLIDIMASPNTYGNCGFTGSVLEAGGSYAASFNPTAIGSPNGGGLSFTGNRGFVGGLTTTDLITTDATFAGNITISANRFFGTSSRTGRNIVANNSSTKVYFDLGSFGDNMLQGYAGVSGGTQIFATPTNSTLMNSLGTDVALNNTGSYFVGPSVAQGTAGTWFASGTVTLVAGSADQFNCRLTDGITVLASANAATAAASPARTTISLSAVAVSPAGNLRIDCQDLSTTTGAIKFNASGQSKDSTITAVRLQ